MASSKEVLTVLGMLCINRKFRRDFFDDPQKMAESVVGILRPDEVDQIMNLAGAGKLPAGLTTDVYKTRLKDALDQVYTAATCPTPPCPDDPDPDPPPPAAKA